MSTVEYGTAEIYVSAEGIRTVRRADDLIGVLRSLIEGEMVPDALDGDVLKLDSAGEYRYRHVGPAEDPRVELFERIKGGDTA